MPTTCASCVVSQHHRHGKSKRRPFPQKRSNLLTNNNNDARRLRRPFNTHALVDDDNTRNNDNRSAENILEKMPKKLEPPQRDTGIPSELDINIDIDAGTVFRVLSLFVRFLSRNNKHVNLSFNAFLFLCFFCEEQHGICVPIY